MKTRPAVRLTLCLLLALACPLAARTMFLAPGGDDSAPPAPGAAFRTLSRAVESLAPGDTLLIRNGVYAGGVKISVQAREEAPVLIRGESLEAVIEGSGAVRDAIQIERAAHVALENLTVRAAERAGVGVLNSHHVRISGGRFADNGVWGIFTGFADDILFENNECYGSKKQHGIYHSNSGDRFVIRCNRVHDNNQCGIHLNGDPEIAGGDGVLDQGVVEGNIVYRNGKAGGAGINMTHVHDVLARNNLLYDNLAGGFTVYQDTGTFEQGSKRVAILNNTVYFRTGEGRSCVNVQTTSEKVLVAGNIFVSGGLRGAFQIDTDHPRTIVSDCNVFWGVSADSLVERKEGRLSLAAWRDQFGNDTRSRLADPLFVDPAIGNFELTSGSPAVDSGMQAGRVRAILETLGGFDWVLDRLQTLPENDLRGERRSLGLGPDAGALERGMH
jgi:hypothetical protein